MSYLHAQQAAHALGHAFQQPVACVTAGVVDRLEGVEIEIKQGHCLVGRVRSRQQVLQGPDEAGPIGEPREFVVPGAAVVLGSEGIVAISIRFNLKQAIVMAARYMGTWNNRTSMRGCAASSAPGIVGPRLSTIIAPQSRGALKLRKQIPPTIAPADTQASVAPTQSPVATLISAP